MNESISIKEGSIGRRIAPVDKLKINTEGDNESLWVPAERGNTGVLYASENGIYIASEDGYESYSEVVVRVTEESFYGDNDFDHWGYEVPTDFPDLWDSLTLDDFNVDPLAFDDLFNNKDKWDMDIPDLPDKLDFKMKDLKTKKPKKEKITGIDPVSGNEMAVGLDNFGHLTQEILPTSIGIITPPSKLVYNNGETILFSGLVVQAYTADGNVWTDSTHPDGIIPMGELFFPVTVANADVGEKLKYATSDIYDGQISFGSAAYQTGWFIGGGRKYEYNAYQTGGMAMACTSQDGKSFGCLGASKEPFVLTFSYEEHSIDDGEPNSHSGSVSENGDNAYTHQNKTVYWGVTGHVFGVLQDASVTPITSYPTKGFYGEFAWTMIYGEVTEEAQMGVPVQWSRPGDGQVLETSFTITVKASGESGGSSAEETQAINYNGTRYVANEDMNAEAHYQSGTVWIRGEAKVWSVPDAVAFGLLKPEEEKDGGSDSGSEHEGGHF
jgi:hypothetical protein